MHFVHVNFRDFFIFSHFFSDFSDFFNIDRVRFIDCCSRMVIFDDPLTIHVMDLAYIPIISIQDLSLGVLEDTIHLQLVIGNQVCVEVRDIVDLSK
jgi:hypothetical protein